MQFFNLDLQEGKAENRFVFQFGISSCVPSIVAIYPSPKFKIDTQNSHMLKGTYIFQSHHSHGYPFVKFSGVQNNEVVVRLGNLRFVCCWWIWGPNYNTLSLFKDGQRQTGPQQLPEKLRGKVSGFRVDSGWIHMDGFPWTTGQGSRGKTFRLRPSGFSSCDPCKMDILHGCLEKLCEGVVPNTHLQKLVSSWVRKNISGWVCLSADGEATDVPKQLRSVHVNFGPAAYVPLPFKPGTSNSWTSFRHPWTSCRCIPPWFPVAKVPDVARSGLGRHRVGYVSTTEEWWGAWVLSWYEVS